MQGKKLNLTKIAISKLFKHGFSSFIFAFALLGILIIINYLFVVKTSYFDITRNKKFTLTEQTKNLLKEINYNINLKVFYLSKYQHRISLTLNTYCKENDRITYELIDPIMKPLIAEKYNVKSPRIIIFEAPNKTITLKPPPRGFNSEREITTAFYRLMSDQSNTVYFTAGHGEKSISNTNRDGINIARDRLLEQNYLVETLNLQTITEIPSDCSVLIIADPTTSFTDEERTIIIRYLNKGGNILLMVSPKLTTNLDNIMKSHGLEFGDDFIYETASDKTTRLGPTAPLCAPMDQSEITSSLMNQNFIFPFVRSVNIIYKIDEMTITRLLTSSEDSWAETNIESAMEIRDGIRPTRDENEKKGPITVAVTSETEVLIPDSTAVGGYTVKLVRSAFFGNAMFITNAIVSQFTANMNLFLNTVNWITRNEQIINITPHQTFFTPVELTRAERKKLSWFTLFIYPFSILMVGLVVWLRTRYLT